MSELRIVRIARVKDMDMMVAIKEEGIGFDKMEIDSVPPSWCRLSQLWLIADFADSAANSSNWSEASPNFGHPTPPKSRVSRTDLQLRNQESLRVEYGKNRTAFIMP